MTAIKNPITSIITRTKNRNLLLERAIKSVLAQTSNNYEHIILNNGGNQQEVNNLLAKYPDPKRKIIHNKKSVNISSALNQAIMASSGEYIAILDDDDSWMSERIEKVSEYFDRHNDKDCVAVQMDRIIEDIKGDTIHEIRRDPWYEGVLEVSLYDQLLDNYLSNGCINYRRDLYNELGGYDESLDVIEDWDFAIRLLLRQDVSFIKGTLTNYHQRPDMNGDQGNTVFAGADVHQRNLIKLRNRYLRKDISSGVFGIGYIMNSLNNNRKQVDEITEIINKQSVRIEGHINHTSNEITDKLTSEIYKASLYQAIRRKLG